MVNKLEKAIEADVVKWAKKRGFLAPKVKFAEDGYPDRLFISPKGHTIFIEFKRPGQHPEPIQAYRIEQLQRRGVPAFWVDTEFEGISILSTALEPETVSGAGDLVTLIPSGRGALPRPRFGKDIGDISHVQNPKSEGVRQETPDSGPSETGLQGLAGRDKEVE